MKYSLIGVILLLGWSLTGQPILSIGVEPKPLLSSNSITAKARFGIQLAEDRYAYNLMIQYQTRPDARYNHVTLSSIIFAKLNILMVGVGIDSGALFEQKVSYWTGGILAEARCMIGNHVGIGASFEYRQRSDGLWRNNNFVHVIYIL